MIFTALKAASEESWNLMIFLDLCSKSDSNRIILLIQGIIRFSGLLINKNLALNTEEFPSLNIANM